jgi:hypothetical protein
MENKIYSNLPIRQTTQDSADATKKYFNQYFNAPVEIDNNFTVSIKSFFEKRGFSASSAESIALVILTQAKKDNFNPQQIIDSLSGLSNVEISGIVAEILNYNRFKTSSLGIYIAPSAADEIQRNILA